MTRFFEQAEKLTQQNPLPSDIVEQLDAYFEMIPEEEKDDFLWFYEAIELKTNLIESGVLSLTHNE